MAKVWVLDTETKGTGAQMVPLEKTEDTAAKGRAPVVVREKVAPAPREPEPRGPRRFKVVDVLTRRALTEDASARETVALLEGVRSMVDVTIYVWEEQGGGWQQVDGREKQMLWGFRGRTRQQS
jgi:hypothetical protein